MEKLTITALSEYCFLQKFETQRQCRPTNTLGPYKRASSSFFLSKQRSGYYTITKATGRQFADCVKESQNTAEDIWVCRRDSATDLCFSPGGTVGAFGTYADKRNAQKVFMGKAKGKRPLGRPCGWWQIVKLDIKETGLYELDRINLARNMDKWRGVLNTIMNLRVPQNAGKCLH